MTAVRRTETGEPSVKLRHLAYVAFTEKLLKRDIKPGQFVSQRELVDITGMPLGAIRELIPRLEAEGLIATVPQRGIHVAHVDLSLIRNAFQFRLILEREATALFAKAAGAELIASLRADHEAIVRRARSGGGRGLIADAEAVDRRLHETIVDHMENEIVSNAYRVNWIKIKLIRQNETRLHAGLVIPAMMDHLKVIAALEKRDADGAAAAMAEHIGNAKNRATNIE